VGHWYMPDGKPFYRVPYANPAKGLRDATIRDARKVGAYPSVTAIINREPAPGLFNWKINQAILAAMTNPEITPDMDIKEINRIIKRDSMAEAKEAANIGHNIHDAIEEAYRFPDGRTISPYTQTVDAVLALVDEHCGPQNWKPETWCADGLGYGGKIDLLSKEWLIDFKTKPGPAEEHKMYATQLMQLAAYDYATLNDKKLANVIVSRDIPGSVAWWSWDDEAEIKKEWAIFKTLLKGWQLRNNYIPIEV
jgi:hypothetical protein